MVGRLAAAGQWNDVDQSNLLYSIIEYDEEVPPIPHDIRFDIREVSGVAADIISIPKDY